MKSAVIHLEVAPERIQDFAREWELARAEAEKVEGFVGGVLFAQSQTGKCQAIGFWETEGSARAFQSTTAYQKLMASIREFAVVTPHREIFEVAGGDVSRILGKKKVA